MVMVYGRSFPRLRASRGKDETRNIKTCANTVCKNLAEMTVAFLTAFDKHNDYL
jgi:hypothetical protein